MTVPLSDIRASAELHGDGLRLALGIVLFGLTRLAPRRAGARGT